MSLILFSEGYTLIRMIFFLAIAIYVFKKSMETKILFGDGDSPNLVIVTRVLSCFWIGSLIFMFIFLSQLNAANLEHFNKIINYLVLVSLLYYVPFGSIYCFKAFLNIDYNKEIIKVVRKKW